jgi:hypothetical protein
MLAGDIHFMARRAIVKNNGQVVEFGFIQVAGYTNKMIVTRRQRVQISNFFRQAGAPCNDRKLIFQNSILVNIRPPVIKMKKPA